VPDLAQQEIDLADTCIGLRSSKPPAAARSPLVREWAATPPVPATREADPPARSPERAGGSAIGPSPTFRSTRTATEGSNRSRGFALDAAFFEQFEERLAQDAGLTTGTVSLIERGRSNPAWGTIKAVATSLGVSISELAKLTAKLEDQARNRPRKTSGN
jgi:DNA-binding XRE family transcriptional regulator